MTAQTARLLVDGNGQIIPNQYYDVVTNSFKASEGGTGISVGGSAVSSSNPLYTRRMIVDTTGAFWFDPDSCSYTLNKNSDGTISTEVYVDPLASKTYTKTYTTTSTQITATGWVAS